MASAKLSRNDILDIVENRENLPLDVLAARYGIKEKTILRYLTGESGSAITGIEQQFDMEVPLALPSKIESLLRHRIDTPTLRAYFGFALSGALMWGVCDSWDGRCFIATDGIIAWRNKGLCELVARRGGRELPALGVERIMCLSLGRVIESPPSLAPNHERVIKEQRLQVHEAVCGRGLLYLTRCSRKNGEDPARAEAVISI